MLAEGQNLLVPLKSRPVPKSNRFYSSTNIEQTCYNKVELDLVLPWTGNLAIILSYCNRWEDRKQTVDVDKIANIDQSLPLIHINNLNVFSLHQQRYFYPTRWHANIPHITTIMFCFKWLFIFINCII